MKYTVKDYGGDDTIDYRDLKIGEYAVVVSYRSSDSEDRLKGSIVYKRGVDPFDVSFVHVENGYVPIVSVGGNLSNEKFRLRRLKVVEMIFELA